MKILIVDDRAENQLLLKEQLRGLDVETVMADSGVRALRELRAQKFDLVVTDLLMPEMDGFQLCYLLKSDPVLKRTPVVIYTANYATKKDEEQAKNLGADDFLTRPIDEDVLTVRLQRVLQEAHSGRIAEPKGRPEEGFFREYSSLLIEKLEDQLITAEEVAKLHAKNADLQRELQRKNTDLTAANSELVRVNQDLEAYSFSVSHDLRAPVRAIEGLVEALVDELGPLLSPEARRLVDRVQFNVSRMDALITGLLEHYRMRNVGAAMQRVSLSAVVASALSGLDFAIKHAGATVQVEEPLPEVMAHEQALTQIVTNLVENALKFVAEGTAPRIVIAAHQTAGRVRLGIRDNGIGVPPGSEERIFNIFERLHPMESYAGTGLGLAIVRRGIERMGGTVGVESKPGEGSTFWLELAGV